ncbi:MAG: peptidylprolyl isomerase [Bacteroidetes bacterium]|nr:MAG: peptidylprolyl isomerase [Bacteroidota bacterium]
MLNIGDTVKVHYTGKFLNGKVFDSTVSTGEPIMFTLGDDMMIPGFEKAVMEMSENDIVTVTIPAKDAYGEYDEELLMEVNRQEVFGDKEIKKGDTIQAPTDEGVMVLKVHKIKGDTVILDANSDLAGKDLIFEIELLEVRKGAGIEEAKDEFDLDAFNDEFGGGDDGFNIDDSVDINSL